jgi:hypothetical protein
MNTINAVKILEVIHLVALNDRVKPGVAKARIASESNFSVGQLERLMRGERVSLEAQLRFFDAVCARKLDFKFDDFFPARSGTAS